MGQNHRQISATPAGALRRLQKRCPAWVRSVIKTLQRADGEVHVVGGQVRDAVLNRKRGDWDLATNLPPPKVAELFKRVNRAGEKHGTIMVLTRGGPVEVTTYRSEGVYSDGRRPDRVRFETNIEADLSRRDFTVNAMAAELTTGRWVDPFSGFKDLHAGRLRCVGRAKERFSEDGLRVLRAFRFAAQLGLEIDAEILAAVGPCLETFVKVAAERKGQEWQKLLLGPAAAVVLAAMAGTPLWAELGWAKAKASTLVEALQRWNTSAKNFELRMAALGWSLGMSEGNILNVLRALRPSREAQTSTQLFVRALDMVSKAWHSSYELRRAAADVGFERLLLAAHLAMRACARACADSGARVYLCGSKIWPWTGGRCSNWGYAAPRSVRCSGACSTTSGTTPGCVTARPSRPGRALFRESGEHERRRPLTRIGRPPGRV